MSRRSRTITALPGAAGLAAVLAGSGVSSAAPDQAPRERTVSYESFTFDLSDTEAARRLAAGEDPATIPGVLVRTGEKRGDLAPSDMATERRIAEENFQRGITYEVDSSTLGNG